jgi:hypothetical protein
LSRTGYTYVTMRNHCRISMLCRSVRPRGCDLGVGAHETGRAVDSGAYAGTRASQEAFRGARGPRTRSFATDRGCRGARRMRARRARVAWLSRRPERPSPPERSPFGRSPCARTESCEGAPSSRALLRAKASRSNREREVRAERRKRRSGALETTRSGVDEAHGAVSRASTKSAAQGRRDMERIVRKRGRVAQ